MILSSDDLGLHIVVSSNVRDHLHYQRQKWPFSCEAGGQLFGTVDGLKWIISCATGPRPTDRRGLFSYVPDINAEQLEIDAYEAKGLIFMGDWHTHYQRIPHPSPGDFMTSHNCVRRSESALPGFLLMIVGRSFPSSPCTVFLVTKDQKFRLTGTSCPPCSKAIE